MVLVDTSVWIEHFRHQEPGSTERLSKRLILVHPCIIGELACGNLKDRAVILSYLHALLLAQLASDMDILHLINRHKLWGRGIGWIDVHLLAAALLSNCRTLFASHPILALSY